MPSTHAGVFVGKLPIDRKSAMEPTVFNSESIPAISANKNSDHDS